MVSQGLWAISIKNHLQRFGMISRIASSGAELAGSVPLQHAQGAAAYLGVKLLAPHWDYTLVLAMFVI